MRLIYGMGSPQEGGCWMAALHWYTRGHGEVDWSDHPRCVAPLLRLLCIRVNDELSSVEREAVIGPELFTPMGTNVKSRSGHRKMAKHALARASAIVADRVRELDAAGLSGSELYQCYTGAHRIVNRDLVQPATVLSRERFFGHTESLGGLIGRMVALHWSEKEAKTSAQRRGIAKDLMRIIVECSRLVTKAEVVPTCTIPELEAVMDRGVGVSA